METDERTKVVQAAFSQVLEVIGALQHETQESESLVVDLQAQADGLEEKRRNLTRQAERAEREHAAALQRCSQAEQAARKARAEAAPIVERFMEAEVLRNQVQAVNDEIARAEEEIARCREELAFRQPQLAEAEDAETDVLEAISQLEAAHAEEISTLVSVHTEELASLQVQQDAELASLQEQRREAVSAFQIASSEELDSLRKALEAARWEADVFRREQQDIIRETCLRQRENARLQKSAREARQHAEDLTIKLDAVRTTEAGAPARQAELQAVRHRHRLLQLTASEWGEALKRKRADCDAWRKWAVQRDRATAEEVSNDIADEDFETLSLDVDFDKATPPPCPMPVVRTTTLKDLITAATFVLGEDGSSTLAGEGACESKHAVISESALSPVPNMQSPSVDDSNGIFFTSFKEMLP